MALKELFNQKNWDETETNKIASNCEVFKEMFLNY